MPQQRFLMNYVQLDDHFASLGCQRLLLVHGKSMARLNVGDYFNRLSERLEIVHFSDFTPNPEIDAIERGVKIFNGAKCDAIAAVGGGSAIDTAKCIKLFSNMPDGVDWIAQPIVANDIPLIAIPTTGGSGSESTQFAVIYRRNEKFSIDDASALPGAIFFDATVLMKLPDYQKKATLLDAFCHAIESMWSIRANDESRHYAREAIRLIIANKEQYISGAADLQTCAYVLYAANLAGRAINISKTTAGHAMSYRLTKKFGLAHGHAVARCVVELWKFMLDYAVAHNRTELLSIFDDLAATMNCETAAQAGDMLHEMLSDWGLDEPIDTKTSLEELTSSVNLQRLANNPVALNEAQLRQIYQNIEGR